MRQPTRMLRAVAILLLLAIFPQGCASMPESSGEAALLCGAGGALAGGAIGAAAAGGRKQTAVTRRRIFTPSKGKSSLHRSCK